MTEHEPFAEQLTSCLFRLLDIRFDAERADSSAPPRGGEAWRNDTFLLVLEPSSGRLMIDSRTYAMSEPRLLLVPGDARVRIVPEEGVFPTWCEAQFQALQEQGRPVFAEPRELRVRHPSAYRQRLLDAAQEWDRGQPWRRWKAAARVQMLLADALEEDERARSRQDSGTIERTAAYMQEHLEEEITRERLAAMAGLNPDYYSRAFKKLYGKSPIAYLTELRMRAAKQRMLASDESVRSVALSVGFHDEFYFSRKFKAETGFAPSVYVNRIKQTGKIASMNHLVTGHLMALDIEPYAAVINDAFPAAAGLRNTFGIGQAFPDLERLMAARPDLIVIRGRREQEKSAADRRIDQIAPTVTLNYADDWRTHLQTIARLIGKRQEADRWLDRYQDTAARLGRRVRSRLGGERVLIVGFGADQRMYVFGRRNIGTVLYDDLRLAVPEAVLNIAHYREITLPELLGLEAERMIFTSFQHDGSAAADRGIQRLARGLAESERWRARREEKNIKVHTLFDTRHLYTSYNAMSHQLLLHHICDLLNIEH